MTAQSRSLGSKRGFRWWIGRILIAVLALSLILIGSIWLAGNAAKSKLVAQYPAPGQLVDVDGYKMHIHCIGQGNPTVIMEAGANDFSVTWTAVQSEIAEFTRVCTYDRAGFGWSEPSPNPRTVETTVNELHTLLDNAEIEGPYLLVGHSFGGMIVRLYAHHYPDEVVGLVLVDSTYEVQPSEMQEIYQKITPQMIAQFRVVAALKSWGLLALAPENTPDPGLSVGALAQYRAIWAATGHLDTVLVESASLLDSFAEMRAANVTNLGDMPLIVLRHGNNHIPSLSEAENEQMEVAWQIMQTELTTQSSNGEQIVAEQSGHYIQLDQPQLVIDVVRQIVEMLHK